MKNIDKENQRSLMYRRLYTVAKAEAHSDTEMVLSESIMSALIAAIRKEELEVKLLTDKILELYKEYNGRITDEAKADIINTAKNHDVRLKA